MLLEAAETFHKAVQVTKDELYNIGPLDRIWVRFGGLLEYKIFVTTDQLLTDQSNLERRSRGQVIASNLPLCGGGDGARTHDLLTASYVPANLPTF